MTQECRLYILTSGEIARLRDGLKDLGDALPAEYSPWIEKMTGIIDEVEHGTQ
jgi:hypothetical protein